MSAPYPLTITLSDLPIPASDSPTREVRSSEGQVLLYLVAPAVMDRFVSEATALTSRVADLERQVAELREDHAVTHRQMMANVPQATFEEEEQMRSFLQQKFVPFEDVIAAVLGPEETDGRR